MDTLAIYTKDSGMVTFKGTEKWPSAEMMLADCCRDDMPAEKTEMMGWPDSAVTWHGDVGYAVRRTK